MSSRSNGAWIVSDHRRASARRFSSSRVSHSARSAASMISPSVQRRWYSPCWASRRRQLMEDKRDPDMDNDEIGNSNEEDIVDSADDEFEDADEADEEDDDSEETDL